MGEVSKGCALLLLHAGAGGDDYIAAGASSEDERLTVLKEDLLLLADDCCCWRRRERLQPRLFLVRETYDRERERELSVVQPAPRVARWSVVML